MAGLKKSASLYRAVQSGRLKTVTTMAGPRIVHLTTRAWLHEYLDRQRRETYGRATTKGHGVIASV